MSGPTESFAISTALAQAPKYRIVFNPKANWCYPYRVETKGWFFWHDVTGGETFDEAEKIVRLRIEADRAIVRLRIEADRADHRIAQIRSAPRRVIETFDAQGRKVP